MWSWSAGLVVYYLVVKEVDVLKMGADEVHARACTALSRQPRVLQVYAPLEKRPAQCIQGGGCIDRED